MDSSVLSTESIFESSNLSENQCESNSLMAGQQECEDSIQNMSELTDNARRMKRNRNEGILQSDEESAEDFIVVRRKAKRVARIPNNNDMLEEVLSSQESIVGETCITHHERGVDLFVNEENKTYDTLEENAFQSNENTTQYRKKKKNNKNKKTQKQQNVVNHIEESENQEIEKKSEDRNKSRSETKNNNNFVTLITKLKDIVLSGSDHLIIKFSLEFQSNVTFTKCRNYKFANWQEYQNLLKNSLGYPTEYNNVQEMYDYFIDEINKAGDQSIPFKKICTNPSQVFQPKTYWDSSLSRAIAERRLALKKFRRNPIPNNFDKLTSKIADAQRLTRRARTNDWQGFCTQIDEVTDIPTMWNKMCWMKGVKPKYSQITESMKKDLLHSLTPDYAEYPQPTLHSDNEALQQDFSLEELQNCLKKKDTAPGDDNITYSMIYNLPNEGSLHVRTEDNRSNKNRFMTTNRERPRVGHKFNDKFKLFSRKRTRDLVNQTDEPPKKKFIKRCVFCKQDHFNDECTNFKTVQDRKSYLGNRCYNCFGGGHKSKNCFSKRKCRHCNKFGLHNRALCPNRSAPLMKSSQTDSLHISSAVTTTLLQTCLVNVSDLSDKPKEKTCRLLLDSGSQRSYITSSIANHLNLPTIENVDLSIFTFGTKSPQYIKSRVVNFIIKTRIGVKRSIYANVVPHITNSVQAPVFNNSVKLLQDSRLNKLILADDGSYGDKIDILIGNDYYHTFISNEKLCISDNLFMVSSDFEWVWSGRVNETNTVDQLSVLTYFQSAGIYDSKLHKPDLPLKTDDVKRLWDLESIGIVDSPKCSRDEEAIKQFNKTIQYKGNRYYVKWPWAEYPPNLPNNLGLAYGRLSNLLKRLDNLTIKSYDKVIQNNYRMV
ncbi:unnamed protein product, partial [Brenthis ino]